MIRIDDSIYFDGDEYDRLSAAQGKRGDGQGDDRELAFYLEHVAATGGPVLELACGTGRLTLPIADAGFDTVGIDISDAMLRTAQARSKRRARQPLFVQGDVRDFSLARSFATILYPDSAMCHLHALDDIAKTLRCVHKHLAPEGRFIVAVFNPGLGFLTRDPATRYPTGEYIDANGKRVVVTENNVYDAASQVNHVRWYYARDGEPEISRPLDLRMYFPQELRVLLTCHGFPVEAVYGDFDRSPLTSASPRQIAVCKPAAKAG